VGTASIEICSEERQLPTISELFSMVLCPRAIFSAAGVGYVRSV
jgi:hypothetical protein